MLQINLFGEPPSHATKWTIVVDSPRELRRLMLFDTQAEVHAEIIRLRERRVAHVFALAPEESNRTKHDGGHAAKQ